MDFDGITITDLDNLGEEEESYNDDDEDIDYDYDDEMISFADSSDQFLFNHSGTSEPEDKPGLYFPKQEEITLPPPPNVPAPH